MPHSSKQKQAIYDQEYHLRNRQLRIDRAKAWQEANPERYAATTAKRHAKLKAATLGCTVEDVLEGRVETRPPGQAARVKGWRDPESTQRDEGASQADSRDTF